MKSRTRKLGAKKIRVNSINPGMIKTEDAPSAGFIGSDFQKQIIAQTPLDRLGQPDDIGKIVAFLALDDSGWITGETFVASGGFR